MEDNLVKFSIDDIKQINENDDHVFIYCRRSDGPRFRLLVDQIPSCLAIEGDPESTAGARYHDLLSPFVPQEQGWREVRRYDRDEEKIVMTMCYVVGWSGRRAWYNRTRALQSLQQQRCKVYGYTLSAPEIVMAQLLGHTVFILPENVLSSTVTLEQLIAGASKDENESFIDPVCLIFHCEYKAYKSTELTQLKVIKSGREIVLDVDADAPAMFLQNLMRVIQAEQPSCITLNNKKRFSLAIQKLLRDANIKAIYSLGLGDSLYSGVSIIDEDKPSLWEGDFRVLLNIACLVQVPIAKIVECTTAAKVVDMFLLNIFLGWYNIFPADFVRSGTDPYQKKLQGGYITKPTRGIYKNVLMTDIDFVSYYPSLIREFKLDFTEELDILPSIVEKFIRQRLVSTSPTFKQAVKFLINNMYGTLGYPHSRFYCHRIANQITENGRREISTHVVPLVEAHPYMKVVFVNTDGLLIQAVNCSEEDFGQYLTLLCQQINSKYEFLRINRAESFRHMMIFATNIYIGVTDKNTIKMKGVHAVHKNSPIAFRAITEKFTNVMVDDELFPVGEKIPRFISIVHAYIRKVRSAGVVWAMRFNVSKLYTHQMDYKDPHVQLALSEALIPGDSINWLYSNEGPVSMEKYRAELLRVDVSCYLPELFKCVKYLCDIYLEEPQHPVTMETFLGNVEDLTPIFTRKRSSPSSSSSSYPSVETHSRHIICDYCKKGVMSMGYDTILKKLAAPNHTDHVTEADFTKICTHCSANIDLLEYINPIDANVPNARVLYYQTSVINILHLSAKCNICFNNVSVFYHHHKMRVELHEAFLLKLMSYDEKFYKNAVVLFDPKIELLSKSNAVRSVDFKNESERKKARVL